MEVDGGGSPICGRFWICANQQRAREAMHNSPGRLRGVEVGELFWALGEAAMSGTKLRLILRLNDFSHSHFDDQRHKTSAIDLCSSTSASANCDLRTKQPGNKIVSQITKLSVYTTSLLVIRTNDP